MKPLSIIFCFIFILSSCKEESKVTSVPSEPTSAFTAQDVDNYEFSKKPFELVCISRIDETGGEKKEMRKVHIEIEDLRDPAFIIELTSCAYLDKNSFAEYDLPEDTDNAVSGITVNGQEVVMRVYTEKPGVGVTERGFKIEGAWKYSPYKKYEIMPDGGYSMSALTVITNNH